MECRKASGRERFAAASEFGRLIRAYIRGGAYCISIITTPNLSVGKYLVVNGGQPILLRYPWRVQVGTL